MSQAAAAERVGVKQASWSRWEKGIWRPDWRSRRLLEKLCKVPAAWWDTAADRAVIARVET